MQISWFIFSSVLLVSGILAAPVMDKNSSDVLVRKSRSPTFHKKHGHGGGLFGGGNNYVTNINNFGPSGPHGPPIGHGPGPAGGSFAGSSAFAGGHGPSSAQSQSASLSLGPFSASFSQSQAQSGGGGRGNIFDYFDY